MEEKAELDHASSAEFVDDPVTRTVIGAAIAVHRVLGPGLLESAYQTCLAHELIKRGCKVEREVAVPVVYDGLRLECGYRIDLLVDDVVVVEVKAVERLSPICEAQLLTYLRLSGRTRGLVINFHVRLLKDGILRRALTRTVQSARPGSLPGSGFDSAGSATLR